MRNQSRSSSHRITATVKMIVPARRSARPGSTQKGGDINGIALRELAHLRQLVGMFEDTAPRPARVVGSAAS